MNTYKITNITNKVGKRDPKFNSVVNIEYVDNRTRKKIMLKAGQDVFLTVQSLPLSVHRLRIKKLIDIVEVSPVELQKKMEAANPKPAPKKPKAVKKPVAKKPVEAKPEPVVEEKKTTTKKTSTRTPRKKTTEE